MTCAHRAVFSALITVACYSLPFLLALGAVAFVVWEADFALWTGGQRFAAIIISASLTFMAGLLFEVDGQRAKLIKALLEDMEQ